MRSPAANLPVEAIGEMGQQGGAGGDFPPAGGGLPVGLPQGDDGIGQTIAPGDVVTVPVEHLSLLKRAGHIRIVLKAHTASRATCQQCKCDK